MHAMLIYTDILLLDYLTVLLCR